MATLADAFVRLRPDVSKLGPELKTKTEAIAGTTGTSAGKKFGGGMLAGIGGVLAAGAVVGFFKGAFDEAREAARITKLTEAVIKSTGGVARVTAGDVDHLATRLSLLSGVDDELIANSENVLLTFTKVRNEAGKGNDIFNQGTEAALNLSAALGTDLQSATILVGKALNDPVKGLTALNRAGIQFTEGQKAQITAMIKAGDTMGAQKIILKELTTQFGGAAAAAASPADKARVAWANFQEMIGTKLLPVLNQLLTFGLKNQDWLVPLVGAIAALGVVIGVVTVATKAWAAAQVIAKAATVVWTAAQWLLNAALTANPIGLVVVAIAALIAVIVLVATKTKWFQTIWRAVWGFVKGVGVAIGRWFAGPFAGFFVGAWNRIVAIFRAHVAAALAIVRGIIAVVGIVRSAFERARAAVADRVGAILSFVRGIPGKIRNALGDLGSLLWNAGRQVVQGLLNGLNSLLHKVRDAGRAIGSAVANATKGALGIGSPSKLFAGFGADTVRGYVQGLTKDGGLLGAASRVLGDVAIPAVPVPAFAGAGAGGVAGVTQFHAHFHGPVSSRKQAQELVLEAYNQLVRERRIRP